MIIQFSCTQKHNIRPGSQGLSNDMSRWLSVDNMTCKRFNTGCTCTRYRDGRQKHIMPPVDLSPVSQGLPQKLCHYVQFSKKIQISPFSASCTEYCLFSQFQSSLSLCPLQDSAYQFNNKRHALIDHCCQTMC